MAFVLFAYSEPLCISAASLLTLFASPSIESQIKVYFQPFRLAHFKILRVKLLLIDHSICTCELE